MDIYTLQLNDYIIYMNKLNILLLSVIIIIFIIIYHRYFVKNYIEGFEHKKGLLLLYGESFREGNQGSRLRDTENSFHTQKIASDSHILFCKNIKNKYNIDMDILINTYDTKYESSLKSWYIDNNLTYMTNTELIGFKLVQNALDVIDKDKYNFILFTRIDIYIKPQFYNIFNPYWDKIYFISQNWTFCQKCGFLDNNEVNYPVVNPIIEFIPKTYYKVLTNINVDHDAWKKYIDTFNMSNNDMDFMVNTYHDTDSYKDFNPYYKMIGRPENNIWYDEGKVIDRTIFGTNKKITC